MQDVEFDASYIGRNPLGDMLETLSEMVHEGCESSRLRWLSEPGALQLSIDVKDGNAHLCVEELVHGRGCPDIRDGQWMKKLDTSVPLDRLAAAVVEEAERNLLLHGIAGFSEDWGDHSEAFPMSAYLRLKGIDVSCGDDDLKRSPLEKELDILCSLIISKGAGPRTCGHIITD